VGRVTEFVSAVPIIPARDIEESAAWYRDHIARHARAVG